MDNLAVHMYLFIIQFHANLKSFLFLIPLFFVLIFHCSLKFLISINTILNFVSVSPQSTSKNLWITNVKSFCEILHYLLSCNVKWIGSMGANAAVHSSCLKKCLDHSNHTHWSNFGSTKYKNGQIQKAGYSCYI